MDSFRGKALIVVGDASETPGTLYPYYRLVEAGIQPVVTEPERVCHGVEIPAYAGCVQGRRMATVAKCEFDREVRGGIDVDAACVVDRNLVSGRTYRDNGHYLGPWIKMLEAAREAGSRPPAAESNLQPLAGK